LPGVTTRVEIFGDKGSAVIENDSLSYLHLARDDKESISAYGVTPQIHKKSEDADSTLLDPANFIQCGQTPYPDAYRQLRPCLRYIHVKDALADGTVVAAGEGVASWPEILKQLHTDGYEGFFSLEPHLASSGQFQGFSGPELFHKASQSFQRLLMLIDRRYE
jgi:sugar phosphate isomerase/epimerase